MENELLPVAITLFFFLLIVIITLHIHGQRKEDKRIRTYHRFIDTIHELNQLLKIEFIRDRVNQLTGTRKQQEQILNEAIEQLNKIKYGNSNKSKTVQSKKKGDS